MAERALPCLGCASVAVAGFRAGLQRRDIDTGDAAGLRRRVSRAAAGFAVCFLFAQGTLGQPDLPTRPPDGETALTGEEIRGLLGSGTSFDFVAVGAPITGTGYWDLSTGTAYGSFEIAGRIKGHWGFPWFIDGDRNCLRYAPSKTVCTHIYAHGDGGFLEVNLDGSVHTVYTPRVVQPLPVPLTAAEVTEQLSRFLVWNQQAEITVGAVRAEGDELVVPFLAEDGAEAWTLVIDRMTGMSRTAGPGSRPPTRVDAPQTPVSSGSDR